MPHEAKTKARLLSEIEEMRRRLAAALSREAACHDLFENIPTGLYQVTPQGRILKVNRHAAAILGYDSPGELIDAIADIGAQIYQTPRDREEVERLLKENDQIEDFEVQFRRRDGQPVWVALSARAVRSGNGRVLYHEGMIREIARRKALEEQSRQLAGETRCLSNFLHSLIDTIPSPIFCKDLQGRYQLCNREFERYAGRNREDIIGRTAGEVFDAEMADIYQKRDAELLRRPGRQCYEHRIVHADGKKRDVVVNKGTYANAAGDVVGIVGVIVDISDRKEAETRMRENLREKETLLHEIHHRVKNNLQVVASLLDLQAVSGCAPEAVEALRSSCRRVKAMSLIHEMLYRSRGIGRIDLTAYVSDLARDIFLAHLVVPGTIALSIRKREEVLLNIDQALPCGLILNELITNAVKHAFPGGQRGEITVEIGRTPTDDIEILIGDNGAGLPADVDPHRSRTVGLHLLRGLVKHQLHGRLEARNTPGATYRICFRSRSDREQG
ncbi:MAG: PAS domain S-box protein [Pseudomonadota bacterium]|nr:PAS domain S-box protein [Pseudomonadota bacterium]